MDRPTVKWSTTPIKAEPVGCWPLLRVPFDASAAEPLGERDGAAGGEQPVAVDRWTPQHRAVLDDLRAGRPGSHPSKPPPSPFLAAVVMAAATTRPAHHDGRSDNGDAVMTSSIAGHRRVPG